MKNVPRNLSNKLPQKPLRKDIFPYNLPPQLDTRCGEHAGTWKGRIQHIQLGTKRCQACRRYARETKQHEINRKRIKAGLPSFEMPSYLPHDLTVAQYEWLKYHSKNTTACGNKKGTTAGYQRHRRAKEEICVDCYLGNKRRAAVHSKKRQLKKTIVYTKLSDWEGVICHAPTTQMPDGASGTYAGVRRHLRYKQRFCDDCAAIKQEYFEYRAALHRKARRNQISAKYL